MVGMTVIGWWRNDVGENVVIATTMIVRVAETTVTNNNGGSSGDGSCGKNGGNGGANGDGDTSSGSDCQVEDGDDGSVVFVAFMICMDYLRRSVKHPF